MATVEALVLPDQRKKDGAWNVKIRVYHKATPKYIETVHFVSERQINRDNRVKNKFLLKILDDTLCEYRGVISSLGKRLQLMTCEDLKQHLMHHNEDVDFIKFAQEHIDQMIADSEKEGQKGKEIFAIADYLNDMCRQIKDIVFQIEFDDYLLSRES